MDKKKTLPAFDVKTGINSSPHVVILGAGASRACCPTGDANGCLLPTMNDLVQILGLTQLMSEAGYAATENFESIYSDAYRHKNKQLISAADAAVHDYFGKLRIPEDPTVYDYLLLSLREKDLIVSFNWDPLLPQAYKRWRDLGVDLPRLAFPHGNVDVEICHSKSACRFISDYPERGSFQPSKLLYPVETKDYVTDPFVKNEWAVCTGYLKQSYCVTVFGYSAPKTDVEARALLLDAWKNNSTATLAEFSIIDIAPEEDVDANWKEFGNGSFSIWAVKDFQHTRLRMYPRRTCEALAQATLQQNPSQEDPFPNASTLDELRDWVAPLIAEEKSGSLLGKKLH